MVKVLCYKSEGHWFNPSWCQWIFHWHKILLITLWPWGRLSLKQKWIPGVLPGGKGRRCVRLTTYHHPVLLSWNLGVLTLWNPLGLSRPVMGLLYLYTYKVYYVVRHNDGNCVHSVGKQNFSIGFALVNFFLFGFLWGGALNLWPQLM